LRSYSKLSKSNTFREIILNSQGIKNIETVEQAALALKPLAGNSAYLLFAIGIIGTGLLSIPVLSGARGYIFAESFCRKAGFSSFEKKKNFNHYFNPKKYSIWKMCS